MPQKKSKGKGAMSPEAGRGPSAAAMHGQPTTTPVEPHGQAAGIPTTSARNEHAPNGNEVPMSNGHPNGHTNGHTNGNGHAPTFVLPASGVDLETLEREFLCQALERTAGNKTSAARLLGLSRDTMRYRLEKYGIH